MDRRTKILVGALGALVGYGVLAGVVYPGWIKPQLEIDQAIAARLKVLTKLDDTQDQVERAKKEYRLMMARVGETEPIKVENRLRGKLNELIERHRLQGANVSPSRVNEDRRTGLQRMLITVTATGPLDGCIGFLKDLAELPQLVRVNNPALYPASSSSARRGKERTPGKSKEVMNLRVPVEALILAPQRLVGTVKGEELVAPETMERHTKRDFRPIWERTPFTEFVPLPPLTADAGKPVTVNVGAVTYLLATAGGGDAQYTYQWSPAESLNDPNSPRPTVDTSAAGTKSYVLTVSDGAGNTATATATVTVKEPPPAVVQAPVTPPPPPPPKDPRWQHRRQMQLCMALLNTAGETRQGEFMVYNSVARQTEFYRPGDAFDGGELLFVHQRGALVRREGEYFVYPIGSMLDRDVPVNDAAEFPELQEIARRFREALQASVEAPSSTVVESGGSVEGTNPVEAPPVEFGPQLPDAAVDTHPGPNARMIDAASANPTAAEPQDSLQGPTPAPDSVPKKEPVRPPKTRKPPGGNRGAAGPN